MTITLRFLFLFIFAAATLPAEIVQRYDSGYLERIEGQQVLHLAGSPYQIGFQHGVLMKEQIAHNLNRFVDKLSDKQAPPLVQAFLAVMPEVVSFIPESLIDEMKGMAAGSELPYDKILLLNLFPEMFHCSGITVSGKATTQGELYHVRVLDYSAANGLQHTAILAVVEPQNGYAFLNVTYAGFIGSVTGMNEKKIALGEIGGKGYGSWKGLPMAFLLRLILEKSASLDDIRLMLKTTSRTCEYHYVFSDGKTGEALAAYATADQLDYINPGHTYRSTQEDQQPKILDDAPEDCIVITRWDHIDLLIARLKATYGHITLNDLQEVIKKPIAHFSNLHNAIFAPATLEVWISHASKNNEPACDQPYHHFSFKDLLHTASSQQP